MSAPPHTVEAINFNRRITHLWILDIDKATMTKYDVNTKLVPTFLGNDPYYPKPQIDKNLWQEFCGAYLKVSGVILSSKGVDQSVRALP